MRTCFDAEIPSEAHRKALDGRQSGPKRFPAVLAFGARNRARRSTGRRSGPRSDRPPPHRRHDGTGGRRGSGALPRPLGPERGFYGKHSPVANRLKNAAGIKEIKPARVARQGRAGGNPRNDASGLLISLTGIKFFQVSPGFAHPLGPCHGRRGVATPALEGPAAVRPETGGGTSPAPSARRSRPPTGLSYDRNSGNPR